MITDNINTILQKLAQHPFLEIVPRGNAAITSALSIFQKGSTILIPAEGGWIHYKKAPMQLGLNLVEVQCDDAKINLVDLQDKIKVVEPAAFLYQNPGGYFAQQPMKEIYELCQKNKCLVILDVSGSIGTALCDGKYADILVGSFGEWKLVEAKVGGFISAKDEQLWKKIKQKVQPLTDPDALEKVLKKLQELPARIDSLLKLRKKVIKDLSGFELVYPHDIGFVVVVKYSDENKKQKIIDYCRKNKFAYTQCPRYMRVNSPAISIELKQKE